MAKRRILSLALAAVLLLSLTVVVSADTITVTTSYTVLKTQTHHEETTISRILCNHTKGTQDTISYTVAKDREHTFDDSIFPSAHHDTLMQAYENEGFVEKLTIPACSGTKIIAAGMPSDMYYVYLRYTYGDGIWNVKRNGETLASGAFYSAPMGYIIDVNPVH